MGEIFNKSYADYSSKPDAERAFAAFKFKWLERVAADGELPVLAARFCITLLPYFNLENGGRAWTYQDTMATKLGVHRQCINKIIQALVERDHLITKRQGRDKPNHYWMQLREVEEANQDVCENVHHTTEEAPVDVRDGRHHPDYDVRDQQLRCPQTRTQNPSTNSGHTTCAPGEREAAAAAAGSGVPASASLRPPPRGKKKKESRGAAGNASLSAGYVPGTDPGFDEMRRNNSARPYADDIDEDHRAYCRALQLIDRDTLLTNHKAYVKATVEGDGAKYLKSIAAWCDGRGWEKPLPKPKRNGSGRRSNNGARRSRGDGAAVREELHEKLAERMRRKEAMQ